MLVSVLVFCGFFSQGALAQECALDVFGLEVDDEVISGSVKNIGNSKENVSFGLFVEGENVSEGVFELEPGETEEVSNSFSFSPGEVEIKLEASSSCAADSETIWHVVLEEYSCSSPLGVQGANFCNYYSRELLSCESGSWNVLDKGGQDYCMNCPFTCGDGVMNCGEDAGTCPGDTIKLYGFLDEFQCAGDTLQQKYVYKDSVSEWVDKQHCFLGCEDEKCNNVCNQGQVPEFICSGDLLKQRYVYTDCSDVWVTLDACEHGCEEGICLPKGVKKSCNVDIKELDFTSNLKKWEMGYVKFGVDSGKTGKIALVFSINGKTQKTEIIELSGGSTFRTFTYSLGEGTHLMEVRATHSCGTEDVEAFEVFVKPKEKIIYYSPPEPPEEKPWETTISINPGELDIPVHQGKVVGIDIKSSEPQNFFTGVQGLPSVFVEFESPVFVAMEGRAFVYITPTEPGTYYFTVTATPENGAGVSREIKLFAVPASQPAEAQGIMGFLPLMIVVISITIVAVIIVAIAQSRRDDYLDYLYEKTY